MKILSSLSFKNYNPSKAITSGIKSMMKVREGRINDVSIIQSSLMQHFENNRNLEDLVNQNKLMVKEIFLSYLITGKIINKTEIKKKAEYLHVNLQYDYFKVAVIQNCLKVYDTLSVEEYEIKKNIIDIVSKIFDNLYIETECSLDQNDNILVLIKFNNVNNINAIEEIIEQSLEDIKCNIENLLNLNISIGVGRAYGDSSNIGVSYKECLEALHYKFLKDNQSVISIRNISSSSSDYEFYYPMNKEKNLISLVKSNDFDKVKVYLESMINDIMTRNKKFSNIEICLSNIIGIIPRCIFELKFNTEEVFNEKYTPNKSIEQFKNIQEFIDWVSFKFRKIIEYQIEQKKANTKNFICEVKEYIEQRYVEDISLSSIANYFNYSPSHFGKIFKEKTGVGLWEYVAEVRIEQSKTLLIETDFGIEQISGLIGYNNRFSYIRVFKKYTSVTPGEFRLKYKNK